MKRRTLVCAALLTGILGTSPAWSLTPIPVLRIAFPAEISAGIRMPYASFASAEFRAGLVLTPADYAVPFGAVLTVEQWLYPPGFPLEFGLHAGIRLCDPDEGLVLVPLWGLALGGRFPLWNQSWRAALSLGFGSVGYPESYEGSYFSSQRIGRAYESRLTASLSWQGRRRR